MAYEDAHQIRASVSRFDSVALGPVVARKMLSGAPRRLFVSPKENTGTNFGQPQIKETRRYIIDLDPKRPPGWTPSVDLNGMRVYPTPVLDPIHVETLEDWRRFWDSLGYSRLCYAGRVHAFTGQILSSTPTISVAADTSAAEWMGEAMTQHLHGYYVVSHPLGSADYTLMVLAYADTFPPDVTPFHPALGRHPLLISLVCGEGTGYLRSQGIASRLAGKRWAAGRFSDSFRDLAGLTEGLNNASLLNIETMLEKRFGSGARDVEVVGLPIPITMIIEGGFLLILTLQLYLLLHLRALNGPIVRPYEIAWIGLYDDPFSWFVYSVSIFALPISCGYILLLKALSRDSHAAVPVYVLEFGVIVALSLTLVLHHPRRGPHARYRIFFRSIWRETWISSADSEEPPGAVEADSSPARIAPPR